MGPAYWLGTQETGGPLLPLLTQSKLTSNTKEAGLGTKLCGWLSHRGMNHLTF